MLDFYRAPTAPTRRPNREKRRLWPRKWQIPGVLARRHPQYFPSPPGGNAKRKGPGDFPSPCVWWSWRELNPRPQAFVRQIYMFSGLIWISLPMSRSRTLHRTPAPYFLAPTQGTRIEASRCNYPCSREALIAQNPLAQPIGQLLQGSLAIKQRVRNVRRLQLVC